MSKRSNRRRKKAPAATDNPAARRPRRRVTAALRFVGSHLFLAVGVPMVLLLAAEFGLRKANYGYPTNLALPVQGLDTYGANMRVGWRFFPRAISRVPLLFSFPQEKPPDTYRIFVLGASAAQGYPDGAFSFARVLESMLRQRFPDRNFEVINTSIVGTNSHVVLPIAEEVAQYDPDLFLVFLGNNEVIGPFGIGSGVKASARNLTLIRWGIRLRATKIGQLLQDLVARLTGREDQPKKWGGMEMFGQLHIASDDPGLARVYDFFDRNMADICRAADRAGIPVVLGTVAVNLWDCPPFASLHRSDLAQADSLEWANFYSRAVADADQGLHDEAVDNYKKAATIDDHYAELQFRLARSYLAIGDTMQAHRHFQLARDYDALRFRTDSRMNDIIRRTAFEYDNTYLADAARDFETMNQAGDSLADRKLFFEHVHLTFAGNYELARSFYPIVVGLLTDAGGNGIAAEPPPTMTECIDDLYYTEWNEWRMLSTILTLLAEYPFTNQLDHEETYARAAQRIQYLEDNATQEVMLHTYQLYIYAVEHRPDDILLRTNYVNLLKDTGQRDMAIREMAGIMRTQPSADWWQPDSEDR